MKLKANLVLKALSGAAEKAGMCFAVTGLVIFGAVTGSGFSVSNLFNSFARSNKFFSNSKASKSTTDSVPTPQIEMQAQS